MNQKKVSENYQHHATITKFIYPYRLTGSGSTQAAAFGFQAFGGVSSGQSRIIVDTQAGAGIGTNLYDNANGYTRNSPLLLDNGTWYRLECQWIYGTPGSNNGALNCKVGHYCCQSPTKHRPHQSPTGGLEDEVLQRSRLKGNGIDGLRSTASNQAS